MSTNERVVIVGDGPIAEIAYEYFTHDSPYEVAGFAVEQEHRRMSTLCNLRVATFEEVDAAFPPTSHRIFVAIGYGQLNQLRARLCAAAKSKGYELATYVSSRAFVWANVEIGENCFIFENNVVQPFVRLGDNITLWSGNHIGHHSTIGNNCFIASHVVISGFVDVGENCFVGVNATVADNVTIKRNCVIGAGALILRDTDEDRIYGSQATPAREGSALDRFGTPS